MARAGWHLVRRLERRMDGIREGAVFGLWRVTACAMLTLV